ncbi:hypothetical protein Poli38472_007290 [Pythium oligandrum]|uniref:Heme haloperoxidase family profile domain-containing protein n=1 Tax=Pythium oligandrum TaxID=41045 RepID=A0A8K1FD79_PYTOL|nr:hypothetical protein Poli38472_007290 [Pythium oligandrum]|eukprot:TMW59145.1 hypothetical protein Poli38472_007290 [Pythium oligandrum]
MRMMMVFFDVETFGELRKDRLHLCQCEIPSCTYGETEISVVFAESALILRGFGNSTSESIDEITLSSFMEFERIPAGYSQPVQLTMPALLETATKIQAIATVS